MSLLSLQIQYRVADVVEPQSRETGQKFPPRPVCFSENPPSSPFSLESRFACCIFITVRRKGVPHMSVIRCRYKNSASIPRYLLFTSSDSLEFNPFLLQSFVDVRDIANDTNASQDRKRTRHNVISHTTHHVTTLFICKESGQCQ